MTEILKKEENKVTFNIVVPAEDVGKAEQDVYKKNRKYFSIPGFRKGKAPKKIIQNVYGKDIFFEDAINELLPALYDDAVKELELEVIAQPNVTIDEFTRGEDVTVSIEVEVKPEVSLGEYKGLKIPAISEEVTEEMLENALDSELQKNARKINVDDRPAKEGDIVTIDFKGSVDGELFEGGTGEDHELELGSGTFIPGFEEQIVGKNIGDEFFVEVKFPEDYHEHLAGKDAVFQVNLKGISYEELPELDDDFVMDVSDFDTVEEYKEDLKKKLAEDVKESAKATRENAVLHALTHVVDVKVPKVMVDAAVEDRVKSYDYNMRTQGMELATYLQMLGTSLSDFKEQLRDEAEEYVVTQLGLEEVIKLEDLEVTDDEIREEAEKVVEKYFSSDPEKAEEMIDVMLKSDSDRMRGELEIRKAIDFLIENAVETDDVEEEEEEEIQE